MNTTCEESKCDRDVFARKREDIIGEQPEENSLKELEALQKFIPFTPSETSKGRGWNGMQAVRYSRIPTDARREKQSEGSPTAAKDLSV
jgi:hypothetical protein